MAELGSASERRGGGGGRGNGERRRWACSVARERGPGERMRGRESERGPGGGGRVAMPGESRAKRQAGGGRRWPCACWRAMGTRPPAHWQEVEDSRSEEEVGWA